jgi:hypothetical protein
MGAAGAGAAQGPHINLQTKTISKFLVAPKKASFPPSSHLPDARFLSAVGECLRGTFFLG